MIGEWFNIQIQFVPLWNGTMRSWAMTRFLHQILFISIVFRKNDTQSTRWIYLFSFFFFKKINKKWFEMNNGTQNHINSFWLLSVNSWIFDIIKLLSLIAFLFLDSWILVFKLTNCRLFRRTHTHTHTEISKNLKFSTKDTPIQWFMVISFGARIMTTKNASIQRRPKMMLYKIFKP